MTNEFWLFALLAFMHSLFFDCKEAVIPRLTSITTTTHPRDVIPSPITPVNTFTE
jgi:hypothetical protein